jgi:hypothetical protein
MKDGMVINKKFKLIEEEETIERFKNARFKR